MSKHNPMITAIEDVNFSKLKFEEAKPNDYSKYQDMSFANMEQTDGTLSTLYFKTPLTDYTIGGLPPAKDRDGNELFKDESERAKWRYYMDDSDNGKKMLAKMNELQDKLIKEKATIVGKKDEKKFELENIIGESQNKEGESMYYVRFNFHTEGPTRQIATKFFVRKDGIDDEIMIKCVSDFESQFRRGEFRYRMIVSLNKVYKQKKLPGKYGVSFKVHQMLIEMRDDVSSVNTKNMFATSQFDSEENVAKKLSEVDLSKNIEAEEDDEEEDAEEAKEKVPEPKSSKKVEVEEEEEDEDEIKPSKVTAKITKAPRSSKAKA
jgi:hypothetical protein